MNNRINVCVCVSETVQKFIIKLSDHPQDLMARSAFTSPERMESARSLGSRDKW